MALRQDPDSSVPGIDQHSRLQETTAAKKEPTLLKRFFRWRTEATTSNKQPIALAEHLQVGKSFYIDFSKAQTFELSRRYIQLAIIVEDLGSHWLVRTLPGRDGLAPIQLEVPKASIFMHQKDADRLNKLPGVLYFAQKKTKRAV